MVKVLSNLVLYIAASSSLLTFTVWENYSPLILLIIVLLISKAIPVGIILVTVYPLREAITVSTAGVYATEGQPYLNFTPLSPSLC